MRVRRAGPAGGALAAALIAGLVVSGCTGGSSASRAPAPTRTATASVAPVVWEKAATLPGFTPASVVTDPVDGTTYVGGSLPASARDSYDGPLIAGGTRRPALWALPKGGSWAQVPLKVTSFYGAQAAIVSLGAYGGRVVGLGAVNGGAHANPRPSFFVGGPAAVHESEQNFYVFGGENAVGISGVAAGPHGLLMAGQWAPDGHRASGALWTSTDGRVFVRHDVIAGLGDSPDGKRTTSPLVAAGVPGGFLVTGSVTDLTLPQLSIAPWSWRSPDGLSVRGAALPGAAGALGGPGAVACSAQSCLLAGLLTRAGGSQLLAWTAASGGTGGTDGTDGATGATAVDTSACAPPPPAAAPGAATAQPPVLRVSATDSGGWLVAASPARGVLCRLDGRRLVPLQRRRAAGRSVPPDRPAMPRARASP